MFLNGFDGDVRTVFLAVGHVVVFLWTRYIVGAARPGLPRLLRALVLAPVLLELTTLYDIRNPVEYMPAVYCVSAFSWLTPTKILAFCLNRGQLAKSHDCGHNGAFLFGLLFTGTVAFDEKRLVKEKDHPRPDKHAFKDVQFSVIRFKTIEWIKQIGWRVVLIVVKLGFSIITHEVIMLLAERNSAFLRDVCLSLLLYSTTSYIQDVTYLLALLTLNVKFIQSFDSPWLSQSVQELWSKRYNLCFGMTLRNVFYDPIIDGQWVSGPLYFQKKEPSPLRTTIAMFMTFAASGLFHGALQMILHPMPFPYKFAMCFVLCFFAISAEFYAKQMLKQYGLFDSISNIIPPFVYIVYTNVIVFSIAHYFLWPELHEADYVPVMLDGIPKMNWQS